MARKWVLITGGSRGIGRALVTHLLPEWNVVFTGRREEGIKQTLALVQNLSPSGWVKGIRCDGCDEALVTRLGGELIEAFGAPAAVIHNAGMTVDALQIHQDAQIWRSLLDNNLVAIVNWHQTLLPAMMTEGRGAVLLMSSVSAIKGNPGQTAYAASKAAMMGMARSLAREVGRFGLRVNCLAPGLIHGEMVQAIPESKLKVMRQNIPLRRLGQAQEVAQAAAFLIGEGSGYITGQTLILDGGLSA
ncbi:SDR family NAD(P)-dependent oxidoreductase [Intestinirhabdus alba]|jgi:3-oxoacyl-[acyl-carrier protein] reductase|uniref:SDR family oxidoreductase n=1 Tax=Intestinirhabdus alba TaxID=2899544 RepID=A0A6L6IJT9_9ENTR|nr:SDR family oxidoreductase [Intestinirhabdus alba]MTH47122.1 SDR family oxidoreductase [Intestinirhabdus alba]